MSVRRKILDQQLNLDRAHWITPLVNIFLLIFLGVPIISRIDVAASYYAEARFNAPQHQSKLNRSVWEG